MRNNKAQMEMSVGTIVTIVLLVTLLILGIVLVKNIFSSATSVVDLTNAQLTDQINKLFSADSKTAILPNTRLITIKEGATPDGAGIGIKNLLQGASENVTFSYAVNVSDAGNCGIDTSAIEKWIVLGGHEESISIASGDSISRKVEFQIPVGAPLCTARYAVDVYENGQPYASDYFDVNVAAQ